MSEETMQSVFFWIDFILRSFGFGYPVAMFLMFRAFSCANAAKVELRDVSEKLKASEKSLQEWIDYGTDIAEELEQAQSDLEAQESGMNNLKREIGRLMARNAELSELADSRLNAASVAEELKEKAEKERDEWVETWSNEYERHQAAEKALGEEVIAQSDLAGALRKEVSEWKAATDSFDKQLTDAHTENDGLRHVAELQDLKISDLMSEVAALRKLNDELSAVKPKRTPKAKA